MVTLITGATGFVGRFVAEELLASGHKVIASAAKPGNLTLSKTTLPVHRFDILDEDAMTASLAEWQVDAVVHLAAISHQGEAAEDLARLYAINVDGCRALVQALVSQQKPIDLLFTSTVLVYDPAHCVQADGRHHVMNETSVALPTGAYGQSKLAAENIIQLLAKGSQVTPYIVRPGNHIGPGQRPVFAVPSFAQRIAAAAHGGSIEVGNTHVKRDFTDVRDIARAYRLILEQQPQERLFTLGASKSIRVAEILDGLVALSGKNLSFRTNPEFVRPGEPEDIVVDASRAKKVLGWEPKIPLDETLAAIYAHAKGLAATG